MAHPLTLPSTNTTDRSWSSSSATSNPTTLNYPSRPPSPPPADHDPDDIFPWQRTDDVLPMTSALPLSPLSSPSPQQTTFYESAEPMLRSPSNHPLSLYAPFRSSPLANSATRATIRRISETGEMEMEDHEEMMEMDDLFVMDDISFVEDDDGDDDNNEDDAQDFVGPLPAIPSEGLFRAGTPTPVVTPPFPLHTVPQIHPGHANHGITNNTTTTTTSNIVRLNPFDGMDASTIESWEQAIVESWLEERVEEIGVMEDLIEITTEMATEISTEELDTECILSYMGCC